MKHAHLTSLLLGSLMAAGLLCGGCAEIFGAIGGANEPKAQTWAEVQKATLEKEITESEAKIAGMESAPVESSKDMDRFVKDLTEELPKACSTIAYNRLTLAGETGGSADDKKTVKSKECRQDHGPALLQKFKASVEKRIAEGDGANAFWGARHLFEWELTGKYGRLGSYPVDLLKRSASAREAEMKKRFAENKAYVKTSTRICVPAATKPPASGGPLDVRYHFKLGDTVWVRCFMSPTVGAMLAEWDSPAVASAVNVESDATGPNDAYETTQIDTAPFKDKTAIDFSYTLRDVGATGAAGLVENALVFEFTNGYEKRWDDAARAMRDFPVRLQTRETVSVSFSAD